MCVQILQSRHTGGASPVTTWAFNLLELARRRQRRCQHRGQASRQPMCPAVALLDDSRKGIKVTGGSHARADVVW